MNGQSLNPRELRILEERARVLAAASTKIEPRAAEMTIAIVGAGEEQFGLPCGQLKEIVRCPRLARLPGVASWCRGLVQIRGEIMTAVDAVELLGLGRVGSTRFVAVITFGERSAGLLVERVIGLRDVYPDDMAEGLRRSQDSSLRAIRATTRDYVSILDPGQLLDQVERNGAGENDRRLQR